MAVKKTPQRMCVCCRQMRDKSQLIRVVRTSDNTAVIDETGKLNGRGAYICKNAECILKAKKSAKLEGALKTSISDEIYEELMKGCGEDG
ncbi:MAG: YlxR family protein [Eubacterium sp.]|nr:YlxR family protein [Eubacterium sp.]